MPLVNGNTNLHCSSFQMRVAKKTHLADQFKLIVHPISIQQCPPEGSVGQSSNPLYLNYSPPLLLGSNNRTFENGGSTWSLLFCVRVTEVFMKASFHKLSVVIVKKTNVQDLLLDRDFKRQLEADDFIVHINPEGKRFMENIFSRYCRTATEQLVWKLGKLKAE